MRELTSVELQVVAGGLQAVAVPVLKRAPICLRKIAIVRRICGREKLQPIASAS
jgi:hypothetical protein